MTGGSVRRAALYARVSTRDRDQDPELQLRVLREFAASRGWETVEYVDEAPAGDLRRRVQWRRALDDAARRRFDVLLVYKLDRGFRSSHDAWVTLRHLEDHGVGFRAVDQPELDTTTSVGRLVFAILAAVAEMEKALIADRVKEGMRNAAAKGTKLGRPRLTDDPKFARAWPAVRDDFLAGRLSKRQAAARLGVGQASVRRLLVAEGRAEKG